MNELLSQWNDYLMARGSSLQTVRNYVADVTQFLQCMEQLGFSPLELDRAKAFLYLGFLSKKYTSRATIMHKRDAVKQFYKFLLEDRRVARNEFDFFDRMREERKLPAHLTQDEAAELLDSIDINPGLLFVIGNGATRKYEAGFLAIRDKALLDTIYGTGTRAQETANLNWADIDFRAGFIRVNQGKGRKDRIIPITDRALNALWEYGKAYRKKFEMEPAGNNPVFQSRRNMRLSTRSIQRAVKLRLELAGIETKMSTHGLRHSFATHLMQRGADLMIIAECLGHASISTTQRYTHITMVDVINNYDKAHPRA
jgi:site-specific recombinase XerD